MLDSGSALGRNCGPLLIKKPSTVLIPESKIAIPGKQTTANLLLSIANPEYSNKVEVLFSEIENKILSGNVDMGLIIHENRFTYQEKGLEKVKDLGEFWEKETRLPIPLGGIVVKRLKSGLLRTYVEAICRWQVLPDGLPRWPFEHWNLGITSNLNSALLLLLVLSTCPNRRLV